MSKPLEKISSCLTRWTLGNVEQLSISFMFMFDTVFKGISAHGRRVEKMILLFGNIVDA